MYIHNKMSDCSQYVSHIKIKLVVLYKDQSLLLPQPDIRYISSLRTFQIWDRYQIFQHRIYSEKFILSIIKPDSCYKDEVFFILLRLVCDKHIPFRVCPCSTRFSSSFIRMWLFCSTHQWLLSLIQSIQSVIWGVFPYST